MATSSELLHQPETSNNGSDESISNCANSSNLVETHIDEESSIQQQINVADSEAATSPADGVHENEEDVDSKTNFSATPPCDDEKTQDKDDEQEQQKLSQQQQEQSTPPPSPSTTQIQEAQSNFSPDEIPEPIKVLDDIISEFEDTATKPANTGGNGENQSEDDGYMSLSRKNMHKQYFENVSQSSIGSSNAPPTITPSKEFHEFNKTTDLTCQSSETPAEQNIIQSTLPKARPASALTSNNYSSLPCCGARSTSLDSSKTTRGVSCNGERNKLGIDISAVHNAVLRGGLATLPEPILNEHPVTIYPGRYSPTAEGKRNAIRPQRILSSVDKHKGVCHILNPLSSISSSSSSSSSNCMGLMDSKVIDSATNNNLMRKPYIRKDNLTNEFRLVSEDDFSDDSIEEQSLSPITSHSSPHKQAGIAWAIHFKSNKKKTKSSAKKKPPRKYTVDYISKTENGVYHLPIVAGDSYYSKDAVERAYRREPPVIIDTLDGCDQQCSSGATDMLNQCLYRQANMLGKGTFIIRRATKKPPTAMDIFRTEHDELDNTNSRDQSDYEEFSSMEGHENCQASEALSSNSRLSLELVAPLGPALPSPRDRLSLNLEPQLPNVFTKEMLAVHSKGERSSSEELLASMKKTSLKRETKRRSTDSINTKSSSYEETEEHEPNDSIHLFSNKNSFDACNLYGYKNDAGSCMKGQEFADLRSSTTTTPHTDLAPTLEEEEEQYSDFSYSGAPIKEIENIDGNIHSLLRGDIAAVRIVEGGAHPKRPLEFRPGVHKSESAKEMKLSQSVFGPLPPSPPSSNPDLFDYGDLPLPPSPKDALVAENNGSLVKGFKKTTAAEIHTPSSLGGERRNRDNMNALRYLSNDLPPLPPPAFENMAPAVPPHRGHSANTMKSWSIDSHYKKRSPKMLGYGSGITTPTGSQYEGSYSTKRYVSYGTKRSLKQSPREELRLQTSCSLPETPIFARGSCDIPRTPFRRQPEPAISGSRTAPRSSTSHSINMGNTMGGVPVGGNTFGAGMCRQRSMNHALASNEMLRLAGAPARGWYPKQRSMRPASTENIDRLSSSRVWDSSAGMSGTGHSRKPLTLPPNLTPSFLNKSPREALRRVTSLLITKKKNSKERKGKPYSATTLEGNITFEQETTIPSPKDTSRNFNNTSQKPQKKKGLFKSLWKKTKHFSLDQ